MNRILIFALLALVFFTGCSSEQSELDTEQSTAALFDAPSAETTAPGVAPTIPEDAPTVVFLGDSLGAGLHLAEHQAFPAVLQEQLTSDGLPFRLVNASESGRTSAGGAGALAWILRSEPDVVVLALGGNDGLRGIPVDDTEANLRQMVQTARNADATVLLLGVRLFENYGDYGDAFDALFPRLAEELEVAFVPFYMEGVGGVPELNLEDGLHPTAEGHELLATKVAAGLVELLSKE